MPPRCPCLLRDADRRVAVYRIRVNHQRRRRLRTFPARFWLHQRLSCRFAVTPPTHTPYLRLTTLRLQFFPTPYATAPRLRATDAYQRCWLPHPYYCRTRYHADAYTTMQHMPQHTIVIRCWLYVQRLTFKRGTRTGLADTRLVWFAAFVT